jgi:hypothetical protein
MDCSPAVIRWSSSARRGRRLGNLAIQILLVGAKCRDVVFQGREGLGRCSGLVRDRPKFQPAGFLFLLEIGGDARGSIGFIGVGCVRRGSSAQAPKA